MKGLDGRICRNRMGHVFMGCNAPMVVRMMPDGLRRLCV